MAAIAATCVDRDERATQPFRRTPPRCARRHGLPNLKEGLIYSPPEEPPDDPPEEPPDDPRDADWAADLGGSDSGEPTLGASGVEDGASVGLEAAVSVGVETGVSVGVETEPP